MIYSNVNPSVSFNTGSKNYYTVDALHPSNSLRKYSETLCTDNSCCATAPYFNTRKPKKHLRRYMKYVPDKQDFSSIQYNNRLYTQTIDDPRYVRSDLPMPTSYEKISQPFHSSWQANTIDEKDIPLVEHALEDIHNKAKHYFALYEAERKRREKLEETAYFFESGNQRLWETLQKETEKAHILIQTLESLKGDPRTLKTIIQRIDLIYIQLDTLVQSLAGLACFMAYKEQSKDEAVSTVLDYLFPCKTLDPRLNALYGTTYYYKQSLSADSDVVNERQAIEVKKNEPNFGKNVEASSNIVSVSCKSTTEAKASNSSQSNVPLEGLQIHVHSISLTSLNESKKILCYFRYNEELPQNVKKKDDRLLFESTIKNKSNVDKTCVLKSLPPKMAGKVPSYCIDIWLKSNDVLHGTATCNIFDPSTLSKNSTWVVKDSTGQSIGFITVTILPVPSEAMLPALRYQIYKQTIAKKGGDLNKGIKSEHVRFESPGTHNTKKMPLSSKELTPETIKKQVLVKKKQLLGPKSPLLKISSASSNTNTEETSSTKSLSTTKPDPSDHHNAEDQPASNDLLEKSILKKRSVENVVSKTTIQVKKKGSDLNRPPNIKETEKSSLRNIQETVDHKSKTMKQNDISKKIPQLKKQDALKIVVSKPTALDSEKHVPSNIKKPVVLDSTKSTDMHLKKTTAIGLNPTSTFQLKKSISFALTKPDSLESKTATVSESKKPAPLELKKPGQLEFNKPGQLEFNKPGQLDLKKSGQLEFKKAGQLDFKKPGQLEFKKPGQLDIKKPGQMDFKKIGQLDLKKLNNLELKQPDSLDLKKLDNLDMKKLGLLDSKKLSQLDLKKQVSLDLKKPGQLNLKKEVSLDSNKPGQLNLKKPGLLDLKKRGQLDLKIPGPLDLKKPGTLDLNKPGPLNLRKPGTLDLKKPGPVDLKKPGAVDLKKPSPSNFRKPGQLDLKKPGTMDLKKPGTLDLKKPGTLDLKKPSTLDLKKPGILDLKKPGILDLKKPGTLDFKKPDPLNLKKLGPLDSNKPGQMNLKKPLSLDTKKSGQLDLKKSIQFDLKKPVKLDLKKSVQVDLKKPVQVDLKKPNRLDLKKPDRLDLKKPVQLSLAKPGRFDQGKSGQLDIEKPSTLDTKQHLDIKKIHAKITTKEKTKQDHVSKKNNTIPSIEMTVQSKSIKNSGTDAVKPRKIKYFAKDNIFKKKSKTSGNSVEKKVSVSQKKIKNLTKNRSSNLAPIKLDKKNDHLQKLTNKGKMKGSQANTDENGLKKSKFKGLLLPKKKITNPESKNWLKSDISLNNSADINSKKMGKKTSMNKVGKTSKIKHSSKQTLDVDKDIKKKDSSNETDRSRFGILRRLTRRLFNGGNRGSKKNKS